MTKKFVSSSSSTLGGVGAAVCFIVDTFSMEGNSDGKSVGSMVVGNDVGGLGGFVGGLLGKGVTFCVGGNVGGFVGRGEGRGVGFRVGGFVGGKVGSGMGFCVGGNVGAFDGDGVGRGVGFCVGGVVGGWVGTGVGVSVGRSEGFSDGQFVSSGPVDGGLEGVSLGFSEVLGTSRSSVVGTMVGERMLIADDDVVEEDDSEARGEMDDKINIATYTITTKVIAIAKARILSLIFCLLCHAKLASFSSLVSGISSRK